MAHGNGTGPAGFGPMTGRAAGYCAGFSIPGYANPTAGRGFFGRARGGFGGRGKGYRNMYFLTGLPGWQRHPMGAGQNRFFQAQMTPEQEIEFLKTQANSMQENINSVNERIKELEDNLAEKEK